MLPTILLAALLSQGTAVQGTVLQAGSREPIARATVQIPALGRGVVTDERGYFVLPDVPAGRWAVGARALGYRPHTLTLQVPAQGVVRVELELESEPIRIPGVEVTARTPAFEGEGSLGPGSAAGPAPIRIDAAVVQAMPALAEPDVLRTLQMLPSIQAVSDFSSALYVRGGLPDQNLLMLDGAPLFNPFHLGGLFSAFDPNATQSVEVLPGAFPAGVGDRLSSAIDVRTREGGRDRVRGGGAVGLVSSRLGVDGPLPGGKGSYLLSARRTYLDLFAGAAYALRLIPTTLPYAFTDAHLKLTHDVGPLGKLSASLYLDEEGLGMPRSRPRPGGSFLGEDPVPSHPREDAAFDWGSRMASLQYWQPVGSSLVAELRAGVSEFHGTFGHWRTPWDPAAGRYADTVAAFLDARTVQRDLFAGADLTWHAPRHVRRAGLQLDGYLLDHDVSVERGQYNDVIPSFRRTDRPWTIAGYAEEEWRATNALSLRGGLRVLHAGEYGTEWLPRVGLRYAATPGLTLSLGVARSAQVLQSLLSQESAWASLVAYDLLAAVPKESGLSTAQDVVLGAEWRGRRTSLRVDAYQKWMRGLPLAPLPGDIELAPVVVPDSVRIAEGRARGLEVLARHAHGRTNLSLSYALSFAELAAGGETFTPRFERRHLLDASAALPLGEHGLLSTRLAWATGQPYTPIQGVTRGYGYDPVHQILTPAGGGVHDRVLLPGEHNSARLPGYFRLDVGARRQFTRRWWDREVTFTPHLSVLNVLNTPNVLFALPTQSYQGPLLLEYPPQLPIFPTFGIEWKF